MPTACRLGSNHNLPSLHRARYWVIDQRHFLQLLAHVVVVGFLDTLLPGLVLAFLVVWVGARKQDKSAS